MDQHFSFEPHEETHECRSKREGDWIVFHCPHCPYERRLNLATGERSVLKGPDNVRHMGLHEPVGLQPELISLN